MFLQAPSEIYLGRGLLTLKPSFVFLYLLCLKTLQTAYFCGYFFVLFGALPQTPPALQAGPHAKLRFTFRFAD